MDNKRDKERLNALEQGLNREADNLSPQLQTRLQQARQQAMAELNVRRLSKVQNGFVGWFNSLQLFDFKGSAVLASLVGASVLAIGMQVAINHFSDKSLVSLEVKPNNSTDVLMSNEDIEFLENMDIYEWLAAEYS